MRKVKVLEPPLPFEPNQPLAPAEPQMQKQDLPVERVSAAPHKTPEVKIFFSSELQHMQPAIIKSHVCLVHIT